ncbi:MAG TPA: fibronectin type III domain-containing protein, partial [bacterium]|nr:fibronectin type III domain-containing protein [bacterium]
MLFRVPLGASDEPVLEVIPPPPSSAVPAGADTSPVSGTPTAAPSASSATASAVGVSGSAMGVGGTVAAAIPPPPAAAARLALPPGLTPLPAAKDGLSMPGYLTAIAGNRSVLLSWYPSEGPKPVSGYLVYRGERPDSLERLPINRDPVTESNFSDSDDTSLRGPKNRHTYYYRVRAFDTDGRLSPYSDLVQALPNGPLLAPGKVGVEAGDRQVVLRWGEPLST